jgi:hypothetical protein
MPASTPNLQISSGVFSGAYVDLTPNGKLGVIKTCRFRQVLFHLPTLTKGPYQGPSESGQSLSSFSGLEPREGERIFAFLIVDTAYLESG